MSLRIDGGLCTRNAKQCLICHYKLQTNTSKRATTSLLPVLPPYFMLFFFYEWLNFCSLSFNFNLREDLPKPLIDDFDTLYHRIIH